MFCLLKGLAVVCLIAEWIIFIAFHRLKMVRFNSSERATIRNRNNKYCRRSKTFRKFPHIFKSKKNINTISQHDRKCDLLFLHQGPEPSSSEEIIWGFGGEM